jgi:hypothetical protein
VSPSNPSFSSQPQVCPDHLSNSTSLLPLQCFQSLTAKPSNFSSSLPLELSWAFFGLAVPCFRWLAAYYFAFSNPSRESTPNLNISYGMPATHASSSTYTLFCAMAATYLLCFQGSAHSFHVYGGGTLSTLLWPGPFTSFAGAQPPRQHPLPRQPLYPVGAPRLRSSPSSPQKFPERGPTSSAFLLEVR